jgi:xanthine dehydrogenase/oxidase
VNSYAILNQFYARSIQVQVRRLGGGFGGKATRSGHVAAACAVAAYVSHRPVRLTLDLNTNMRLIGKRLPYLIKYEVSFDDTGKIQTLDVDATCDPGFSPNEETTRYFLPSVQNCYASDGWSVRLQRALTDTPANTFCRAPGTIQIYSLYSSGIVELS